MNECSWLLAVHACSWWCDGFGGRVKSWIWSSWLWCSLFLWICPLARGGADTCSLCLGSSTQKVKKNIWCLEQTGEANLVCCLHIIISVRQLAPTHQEIKKMKIASTLDSFLCVCDFDLCDVHQRLRCFQGAQISSACCLGGNKTYYCENVYNNAFFSRDMDKINIFMS